MRSKPETVYHSGRFVIDRATYTDQRGNTISREFMRHPGAVVLLPISTDGRVIMIRNYRVSVDQVLLELPAGTIEPSEPPEVTAARELVEETGYRAGKLSLMQQFFAAPGVSDELMHLYLAEELQQGDASREAGEDIENELLTWSEVQEKISNREIIDAKSLVGLLLYMSRNQTNG